MSQKLGFVGLCLYKSKKMSISRLGQRAFVEPKDHCHKLCFCKFQVVPGESPMNKKVY